MALLEGMMDRPLFLHENRTGILKPTREPLTIKSLCARDISDDIGLKLCEVTEDIWAGSGILEYCYCSECNKILSKQEVYGGITGELYQKTVADIRRILGQEEVQCPCCGENTKLLYNPKEYLEVLKDKYRNSVDAFLTIVETPDKEIVGFAEGYVDSVEKLFARRDLGDHYGDLEMSRVHAEIKNILGYNTDYVFLISAIGLMESYVNPFILINLLREFTGNIPKKYDTTPGIMELEKGHILYAVSETLGAKKSKLCYPSDGGLNANGYGSDLLIFQDPIGKGKENFSSGIIRFLRKRKNVISLGDNFALPKAA